MKRNNTIILIIHYISVFAINNQYLLNKIFIKFSCKIDFNYITTFRLHENVDMFLQNKVFKMLFELNS